MSQLSVGPDASFKGLSFLWLELTNRCNLECVHCYTESSPWSGHKDSLTKQDYLRALDEAASAGCREVQFIGGEPTLNSDLPGFIKHASEIGYTFIEVYTNLIRLPEELIKLAKQTGTQFATSVYSADAEVHDAVTGRRGSHARTISNLQRLLNAEIPVRVGYIETDANNGHWDKTVAHLEEMGVADVGFDVARGFGRAAPVSGECDAGELCGRCWDERLCVAPDGQVSPCIMSKAWSVGNIKSASVEQIAFSTEAIQTRSLLYARTRGDDRADDEIQAACRPGCGPSCGPDRATKPGGKTRVCSPDGVCGPDKTCKPDRERKPPGQPGTVKPAGQRCRPDVIDKPGGAKPVTDRCRPDVGCRPQNAVKGPVSPVGRRRPDVIEKAGAGKSASCGPGCRPDTCRP
jgi:sulfatase maturation enzyme AslB (radical SAM superfamily)